MNILVIDDDKDSINLIRHLLQKEGYSGIQTALSAEEGQHLLRTQSPDLILLDVMMPLIDGCSLCRILKSDEQTKDIPVIIITGGTLNLDESIKKAFDAGATDYITKPILPAELICRIQSGLRLKKARDDIRAELANSERLSASLQASKDFLNSIFSTVPCAIIVSDRYGYITTVNEMSLKMLGYSRDEIIGKHIAAIAPGKAGTYETTAGYTIEIGEDFFEQSKKMIETLFDQRKVDGFESCLLKKDGKAVITQHNTVLMYNEQNQVEASASVILNITEHKRAEEVLRKSEERYRHIFNSFMDIYFCTDTNGVITDVSPSVEALSGWTVEDLVGKSGPALYHDPEERGLLINALREKGEIFDYEITFVKKNGTSGTGSVNYHLYIDMQGRITGIEGTIRDITASKRAEKALGKANEFLENVFRTSGDGLIVTDNLGYITKVNNKAMKLFGYNVEELTGKHFAELGTDNYTIGNNPPLIELMLAQGFVENYETEYKRKDATTFQAEVNIIILKNEEGELIGAISSIRDITERKRAEAEREKLIKELTEALENIKVLKGILPTCSHCKKIRNEKGGWEQIEVYIRDRSHAEFSHGICPDCMKKYYSDFMDENGNLIKT